MTYARIVKLVGECRKFQIQRAEKGSRLCIAFGSLSAHIESDPSIRAPSITRTSRAIYPSIHAICQGFGLDNL